MQSENKTHKEKTQTQNWKLRTVNNLTLTANNEEQKQFEEQKH